MIYEAKHPLIRLMTASVGITALGIAIIGIAAPGAARQQSFTALDHDMPQIKTVPGFSRQ